MSGQPSERGGDWVLILLVGLDAVVWFLLVSLLLTPRFLGHALVVTAGYVGAHALVMWRRNKVFLCAVPFTLPAALLVCAVSGWVHFQLGWWAWPAEPAEQMQEVALLAGPPLTALMAGQVVVMVTVLVGGGMDERRRR
jgi:hypothetical protein